MMHHFLLTATVLVFFSGCETQAPGQTAPDRSPPTPTHQVYAFTADWCEACQRDKPGLADLRRRGVHVVEIDCDARPDLVAKYRVRRLPTYIVLKDGEEVERTESILLLIKILRLLLLLF
jgi:thiol-disulfide isomerase/thioredoxin